MIIAPFEIFRDGNFSNKSLAEIQAEVNKAYKNKSLVMRNGELFQHNFRLMFGHVVRSGTRITGANVLQLLYFISDPREDDINRKVLEWEKRFLDKMSSLSSACFEVFYEAERSKDDAIADNSGTEMILVPITFIIMILFACIMLGKFFNPLTGHSLLANSGVFAVALGILAGIGIGMWCRVTFVNMVVVLPYLVLSIGIDDMFILVDELDRQPREFGVVKTVKEVMSHTGATVTMTTMTDLVAFAVSTLSAFPAIR